MDSAEAPGADVEVFLGISGRSGIEPWSPATGVDVLLHGISQRIEHAGNGDHDRSALAPDGAQNVPGMRRVFQHDGGAQQRRHEHGHELAKNMAERNKRDKSQRMKPFFALAIFLDASFDWLQVRQKIAMGQNYAARLAGGAGSEENLSNISSRSLLTRSGD